MEKDLLESLLSELRRGTLILCVLSQLGEARYGYALVQILEEKGIPIDANTIYPLLGFERSIFIEGYNRSDKLRSF